MVQSVVKRGVRCALAIGITSAIAGQIVVAQRTPVSIADNWAQTGTQTSPAQKKDLRVTLSVKDSTILSVLQMIARQAKAQLVYNTEDAVLNRRISVQISEQKVMAAFAQVLRETGLIAIMTSDRTTIAIRPGTTGKVADSVSVGTIVGQVTDSTSGSGLVGVTVIVQGTKLTTLTSNNGTFTFANIPTGEYSLTFKVLGYASVTRTIRVEAHKRATVRVTLKQTASTLSSVVTTATGTQRRVEVASDIVRIDADKIMERSVVRSVTDLIEAAQVPGVFVSRGSGDPGAPTKIRIRGLRSMTQSNDPVVIVDGSWIDATVGTPSGIDDIDPSSIETVEIVRGPSATTLYGPDAANGVIVITTRKGRAGPTRWRTSYQRDWGQTYGAIPLVYSGSGIDITRGGERVYCPIETVIVGGCVQDSVAVYDPNHPLLAREGVGTTNRYSAGIEGGTSTVKYSITGSMTNTIGVQQLTPIERVRLRILDIPLSKKFERPLSQDVKSVTTSLTMLPTPTMTLGLTVAGSQSDLPRNRVTTYYDGLGSTFDAIYSLDTVKFWKLGGTGGASVSLADASSQRTNVLLSGTADWRPLTGWFLKANVGVNRTLGEVRGFTRQILCSGTICRDTVGSGQESFDRMLNVTGRFTVTKQLHLGAFSRFLDLQPSFGGDYRKISQAQLGANIGGIPVGTVSLLGGSEQALSQSSRTSAVAGWYATVRVGILQRLYFDLGGRQDIGSALKSLVSGTRYPKLGGSYLISDEPFWPRQSVLKTLRFRAAIGYSSIQPDLTDIKGSFRSGLMYQSDGFQRMLTLTGIGNTALIPERVMEVEMGFDADLFEDRVSIIATYAHSNNYNAMVWRTLPPSAGASNGSARRKENLGQVRNRNFELSSQFRILDTKLTRVEFSHTLTLRENVVARLGNKITPFSNTAVGRIREGYPIAGVWVQRMLGYQDINDDGLLALNEVTLSDSLAYAGWTQPRYEAGYGLTVTLLGRLSFDTRFSQRSQYVVTYSENNRYALEDATAPLNAQAAALANNINQKTSISDIRWNSASVVYYLPQRALAALRLRTLSVGLKASNLQVWTNYSGRDPGVNSAVLSSESFANNNSTTPLSRRFTLDFNIGL